jgi:RNA-directed DNA polymerase
VTRCADDVIRGFALEADAHRVMDVWPKRFHRFGLTIHPEKTVLRAFQRPPNRAPSARGKGTVDFLGFPHYWATMRRGYWVIKRKTVGKRLRRCMKGIWTGGRENRHAPLNEQYRALGAKLRGHYQYDGIRGNFKRREAVFEYTERAWQYGLSRRSHTGHLNWQKFVDSVHRQLPLPKPRIMHHI